MPDFSVRFLIALIVSCTGVVATQTWYNHAKKADNSFGSGKPIARLVNGSENIRKKPTHKLIWLQAELGDDLYAGEALRTGSDAEAVIEFIDSKVRIDLEPDSAIILEKDSLDFIQGNLFIQAGENSNLTLKSGDQKLAVGKSELSLNRGKAGKLDVSVLEGTANLLQGGKELQLNSGSATDSLQLLWPKANGVIPIDPAKNEKAKFVWKKVSKLYQVQLETGTRRSQLSPLSGAAAFGDAGELHASLKLGKLYFRLIATPSDPKLPVLKSPVLKAQVVAKVPPILVSPAHKSNVMASESDPVVEFQWASTVKYKGTRFELSTSKDFKKLLYSKDLIAGTSNHRVLLKSPRIYFWRVKAYLDGLTEPVVSDAFGFRLKITDKLLPPKLIKPLAKESIPYDGTKEFSVNFQWEAVDGAKQYEIKLRSKSDQKFKTKTERVSISSVSVDDLKPGLYAWTARAMSKGKNSAWGDESTFEVTKLPSVPWADGQIKSEYMFTSLEPEMLVEWKKGPKQTKSYQVYVRALDENNEMKNFKKTTRALLLKVPLPQEGNYETYIRAFDAKGVLIARSPNRTVRVYPKALLPPPEFQTGLPEELKATGQGTLDLSWKNVEGAKEYKVLLSDESGENKEFTYRSEKGRLLRLMPGDYKIQLQSIDNLGRPGPVGEERILRVPATSNMKAPKLKGFKVK